MKVTHLNHSDMAGGAARAANRIHRALRCINVDSRMLVNISSSDDWTIYPPIGILNKARISLSPQVAKLFRGLLKTENKMLHTPAVVPSGLPKILNMSSSDIINLHWVGWEMLSISDIGKIRKPIVWTLHDMWAFCGAEHLTYEGRWKEGYLKNNRPSYESGFDMNRWNWLRKLRHWDKPINIVSPSCWLAECVKDSPLMCNWPVSVIPNPLDLTIWKPAPKIIARTLLGLPLDIPLIMFGAMGGGVDPNKGFDLLIEALNHLRGEGIFFELIIFGQSEPKIKVDYGFQAHYIGHLHDDISLRLAYSAADVMVVPSRLEAFGQTASEAHACGTPVVAFNVGGLRDIIDHKITGYLAKPHDPIDLAAGMMYVLTNNCNSLLGQAARSKAELFFDANIVAKKYKDLYEKILTHPIS